MTNTNTQACRLAHALTDAGRTLSRKRVALVRKLASQGVKTGDAIRAALAAFPTPAA